MYSDIIQELRGRFRCVALDLPGFGLSAAAPGFEHTLTGDSRLLERFISTLGLIDVTLFSHDVTGSIALGVVARRPEWFRAVIVLPSFAWPLESYHKVYPMIQLIGSPMFRFLSTRFNFFLEYTLKTVTKKPKQPFSDLEKQAYRGPNLDRAVRRYPHDLFKSVTKSHDYLVDLEQRLSEISVPIRPAVLTRPANDAGASTAAQSGGTSGEGDASAADLWRGCYNQNGVVGSPGAHLSLALLHRDAGVPPFSPSIRR
jgi:haloalkane dehalogenase